MDICPFMSTPQTLMPCRNNCSLFLNGECSLKIIAQNQLSTTTYPDLGSSEHSETQKADCKQP